MRHGILKAMAGCAGLCGLLAGCATSVDMGGPLGHYRYSYDSRPVIHEDDDATYHRDTYTDRYSYDEPRTGITLYHHDDDDD
jgi:hypothetical protein